MTLALGLFYAGLVRSKNPLNTFMLCIAPIAVATVTWAVIGYSFAFDEGNDIIGGFDYAFLSDVTLEPREGSTIPHLLFFAFQATFWIITTRRSRAPRSADPLQRPQVLAAALALAFAGWPTGPSVPVGSSRGEPSISTAASRSRWASGSRPWRRRWRRRAQATGGGVVPHTVDVLVGAGCRWFAVDFHGGSASTTGVVSVSRLPSPAHAVDGAAGLVGLDAIPGRRVTAVGAAT